MARKELFTGASHLKSILACTVLNCLGYRLGSDRAPTVLQFFWDFTCPFSAKSFLFVTGTLAPAVESKSPGQFAFEFRHQVQPWHPQTVALHEAAIAAHRLKPEAFIPFARALFENLSSCVLTLIETLG